MAMFDHGTIITFTPRNLITVAVMVTIGWFFLHLASVGFATVVAQMDGLGVGADAYANDQAAAAGVEATY